ncbi:hypothetical protein [Agitococcus lubricus]|uniref:Uncharacterized protein n=1 Tax=Agitococcus lubricus TaxID=1077255 RepID=A0A2T5IYL0_9GAMM|nr:hypothetical protein [Agitococcus lubricus]PTQ89060.1 hypothetical protein C8N29_10981 [Agitococcus lubricus]
MRQPTYVIRAYFFGYNDETFYVSGSRIQQVFHDKAQAEAAYKRLEIDAAREFPLHELDALFNASEEDLQALDQFVFERCGEHILGDGWLSQDTLTDKLNDEDTFEFIQRAGCHAYQLVTFEQEPAFFAVWLPHKESYYIQYDEFATTLVYAASKDALIAELGYLMYEFDNEKIVLTGALDALSPQPMLLTQVIKGHSKIAKYDESNMRLTLKGGHDEEAFLAALLAINELLNTPIIEIRTLSLAQVKTIEQELAEQMGESFGWDEE